MTGPSENQALNCKEKEKLRYNGQKYTIVTRHNKMEMTFSQHMMANLSCAIKNQKTRSLQL